VRYAKTLALALLFGCAFPVAADDAVDTLTRILAGKNLITASDVATIEAADPNRRVELLTSILQTKGVLDASDLAKLTPRPPETITTVALQSKPVASPPSPSTTSQTGPAASPQVTSQSKVPLTVYGTILLNAFSDTSLNNIEDIPLLASKNGSDASGNDKSFGMTVRQSRFGLQYDGPEFGGAKISGQFEFDLLGGEAAFGNGVNMDLFRVRLALGRLDWTNFSLVAGQDWSVFAPLNPTSLAEFAIPEFSASGNPWIRTPQLRAEFRHALSESTHLLFQLAAVDPDMGDYSTTEFSSSRTPAIGERGRLPGADGRLALTTRAHDRDFTIGVSGHYARGKNAGMIGTSTVQTGVDSWGVALDYTVPLLSKVNWTGEAYEGRALGIFSVNSGQSILAVGTAGEHGVQSGGGWTQLQFNMNKQWQVNVGYGIDIANVSQLLVGDRSKNQSYMGNLMYKWSPSVTFAWEWRRFLTDYRNQQAANNKGDQANLAVAYTF
jgi:hypothetical protein